MRLAGTFKRLSQQKKRKRSRCCQFDQTVETGVTDTNTISLDGTHFCVHCYLLLSFLLLSHYHFVSQLFPIFSNSFLRCVHFARLHTCGWSSDRSAIRRLRRLQVAFTDFSTLPSLPGHPVVVEAVSLSLCSGKWNASSATNMCGIGLCPLQSELWMYLIQTWDWRIGCTLTQQLYCIATWMIAAAVNPYGTFFFH